MPTHLFQTRTSKLRVDDARDESLYCWQHKEQASLSARSTPGPRLSSTPVLEEERTSLDTLADRLGLVAQAQDEAEAEKAKKAKSNARPGAKVKAKPKPNPSPARPPPKHTRPKARKELHLCCCFRVPIKEVETTPAARPRPRPVPSHGPSSPVARPSAGKRPSMSSVGGDGGRSSHHSPTHSTSSQTAQYLSLIPSTASPQTASLLMSELAKPMSRQDEAGYIYIFWLTPTTQAATAPIEAARSLLAPPTRPTSGQRRASDVFASFADGKILLKIGRATNVQRRLNEWQRQCGYKLSLMRYYPGIRVADREKCAACGREHREWFEVEASRTAVGEVDEVVKRWVDWDEKLVQA
ncbi:hypothetical protein P8C59_003740 [Phyllachora maydis]|uniref:Bacteriophage T5 Orf172 DNA-binding domain-containing protein n=1 Tax=Phyllachora maydis TaxID=1825666 RepID=A0AAD9MBQ9_9PEZI|nr:hypothetical protein P8C59_003740 [Phyllachora maydis]